MKGKINSVCVVRVKIGEQDRRIIIKKYIIGENAISYTLGEERLYHPDLYFLKEIEQ